MGTYISENLYQSICEPCIEEGNCLGGYIPIIPKENYWRINNSSNQMAFCYNNPSACLVLKIIYIIKNTINFFLKKRETILVNMDILGFYVKNVIL